MPHGFPFSHFGVPGGFGTHPVLHSPEYDMPFRLPGIHRTARVEKVKEALIFIEWKIDIRNQLITLQETHGRYCATCGTGPTSSYCSTTCPLRQVCGRPRMADQWMHSAKEDVQLFKKLTRDIDTHGAGATRQMVKEWEAAATDLLKRTEDSPNRVGFKMEVESHPGFDKDWTFDGHWGKGPGLEVEYGADESEGSPAL